MSELVRIVMVALVGAFLLVLGALLLFDRLVAWTNNALFWSALVIVAGVLLPTSGTPTGTGTGPAGRRSR